MPHCSQMKTFRNLLAFESKSAFFVFAEMKMHFALLKYSNLSFCENWAFLMPYFNGYILTGKCTVNFKRLIIFVTAENVLV